MNYVGIDWAYGRAAFCAMSAGGAIVAEGLIPANEDGLARLVLGSGTRTPTTRGRSPPLTARPSSKRKRYSVGRYCGGHVAGEPGADSALVVAGDHSDSQVGARPPPARLCRVGSGAYLTLSLLKIPAWGES
jgi:hypothetical protein